MKLVGRHLLDEFAKNHAAARKPLQRWSTIVKLATWTTPHEIKQTLPSTDFIGNNKAIFNIGGNKFRLVAIVTFHPGICRVKWIGTHAEYDKGEWKKEVL